MPEEGFEERTLPATPRKRQETRESGNVARSVDLSSAVILLAAVLALSFLSEEVFGGLLGVLHEGLGNAGRVGSGSNEMMELLTRSGAMTGMVLLPLLAILFAVALGINLVQVGFMFTLKSMEPSLDKLDPIAGLKRIFSMRGFMRLVLGLLKVAVIGAVLLLTLWGERERLLSLSAFELPVAVGVFAEITFDVSLRAALALLVLALLDFGYQRWQHERDIRMSRTEAREELKQFEGDPKIRERRRAIQRQLAMQRMMAKVPKATVVVTNPTELSIALQYEENEMAAPTVVAKGAGHVALRIRSIAMEHDIPIVQRPEVARVLYRTTEVGQTIPVELYQAVAEILAFVYRLKGKTVAA